MDALALQRGGIIWEPPDASSEVLCALHSPMWPPCSLCSALKVRKNPNSICQEFPTDLLS